MYKVRVEYHIPAPIEKVFFELTDHANYKQFPGIKGSVLTKTGNENKNGSGAQRKISLANGVWLLEDITAYEENRFYEYLIGKSSVPIVKHRLGRVEFSENNGGTDILWMSNSEVPIPLIGGFLEKKLIAPFSGAFKRVLKTVEAKLT